MLKLTLCDYRDVQILVTRTITIAGAVLDDASKRSDERNKEVIFKNCTPITD